MTLLLGWMQRVNLQAPLAWNLLTKHSLLAWYNVAVNNIGPYSDSEDGRLLVYCNDDHLTSVNVNLGQFRDVSRPGVTFMLRPGMNKACSNGFYAFGYPISVLPGITSGKPYFAIVLCRGYTGAALDAPPTNFDVLQRTNEALKDKEVMAPASMMTGKILHEFMHMAGPMTQCKWLISTEIYSNNDLTHSTLVPTTLPDGGKEVYSYGAIAQKDGSGNYVVSARDKLHNAESFALTAIGKWRKLWKGSVADKSSQLSMDGATMWKTAVSRACQAIFVCHQRSQAMWEPRILHKA